jgi:hypothetical protein
MTSTPLSYCERRKLWFEALAESHVGVDSAEELERLRRFMKLRWEGAVSTINLLLYYSALLPILYSVMRSRKLRPISLILLRQTFRVAGEVSLRRKSLSEDRLSTSPLARKRRRAMRRLV